MKTVELSLQSPDLNPVENLWRLLKIQFNKRAPKNILTLKRISHKNGVKYQRKLVND